MVYIIQIVRGMLWIYHFKGHCKFKSSVLAPKMGPFPRIKYSTSLGANLALLIKATIVLFTGAGLAPKGQI